MFRSATRSTGQVEKMMVVAGRRNLSRNRMSCRQALKPLGHGDLCTMFMFEKRTILMKSRKSIWDRS